MRPPIHVNCNWNARSARDGASGTRRDYSLEARWRLPFAALCVAMLLASCSSGRADFVSPDASNLRHEAERVSKIEIAGRRAAFVPYSGRCKFGESVATPPIAYLTWEPPLPSGEKLFSILDSALLNLGYLPDRASSELFEARLIKEGAREILYYRTAGSHRFRLSVTQLSQFTELKDGLGFERGTLTLQLLINPDHC